MSSIITERKTQNGGFFKVQINLYELEQQKATMRPCNIATCW